MAYHILQITLEYAQFGLTLLYNTPKSAQHSNELTGNLTFNSIVFIRMPFVEKNIHYPLSPGLLGVADNSSLSDYMNFNLTRITQVCLNIAGNFLSQFMGFQVANLIWAYQHPHLAPG